MYIIVINNYPRLEEYCNVHVKYSKRDLLAIKRVIDKTSDFWISTDKDENIKGSFVIGFGYMPRSRGISAEAISGKFDFSVIVPVVEKYYKKLGFDFFEMTGRKGWEKVMEPLGFDFKTITIRKEL